MKKTLPILLLFFAIFFISGVAFFFHSIKPASQGIKFNSISPQAPVSQNQETQPQPQSKVADKKIEIKDKMGFANFLHDIGFWQVNGVVNLKTNKTFTANKLNIILDSVTTLKDPTVQTVDANKVTWSLIKIDVNQSNGVMVSVFHKDWNEYAVNLLINEALWRTSAKYRSVFSQELTDQEKQAINQQFFRVMAK